MTTPDNGFLMNISTKGDKESTTVHYYFSLTRPVSQSLDRRSLRFCKAMLFFNFNAILVISYELILVLVTGSLELWRVSKPKGMVALRRVFWTIHISSQKCDFFGDASLGNIFHDKPSTPMFVKNVWKWSDSEDFVLSVIQEGRRLYRWTCSETRGEGWWGQGETFPGSSCLAGPACFMMAWEACRSTTTL